MAHEFFVLSKTDVILNYSLTSAELVIQCSHAQSQLVSGLTNLEHRLNWFYLDPPSAKLCKRSLTEMLTNVNFSVPT